MRRWLQEIPGGDALFEDFMSNLWEPARRAFERGDNVEALRVTGGWFSAHGYLIGGKKVAFDDLPQQARAYLTQNALEWKALTLLKDAYPMLGYDDVRRTEAPTLMLSGGKTLEMLSRVDHKLEALLPNRKRIVIPDATHEMWSEHPDLCRDATLEFISAP